MQNIYLNRGKGSDGIVIPLELAYFVNTVYSQLQLCTTPSKGRCNYPFSSLPPLFADG